MPEPKPAGANQPLFFPMLPGYRRTKARLSRLTRFKNLVIHRERWSGDINNAPPLSEIFPGESLKEGSWEATERINAEIKHLMVPVCHNLNEAGIHTGVTHEHYDPLSQQTSKRHYDVIDDYYRLPRDSNPHEAYEMLMEILEKGIGVYRIRLQEAKWDMFSPVAWLAYLVRLPITVMERAGFGAHEKTQNMLLGTYAAFLKIMMGLILALIALLLGVKIPWGDIMAWLIKAVLK